MLTTNKLLVVNSIDSKYSYVLFGFLLAKRIKELCFLYIYY